MKVFYYIFHLSVIAITLYIFKHVEPANELYTKLNSLLSKYPITSISIAILLGLVIIATCVKTLTVAGIIKPHYKERWEVFVSVGGAIILIGLFVIIEMVFNNRVSFSKLVVLPLIIGLSEFFIQIRPKIWKKLKYRRNLN